MAVGETWEQALKQRRAAFTALAILLGRVRL